MQLSRPVAGPALGRPGTRAGTAFSRRRDRRTWVSWGILLAILCAQATLSLRMHNTAFEDEALYLYAGRMELAHLLHGAALQGSYAAYFSGAPVLYPVLEAVANAVGGLAAARAISLIAMLVTTALLYSLTRLLFNERVALCAAAAFSVTEPVIFLGNLATFDAPTLCLLALASWIATRGAQARWPVYLLAAPVAALAVATKYAALLFVPTIAVLPALAVWPARGRRALMYPILFALAVTGILVGALRLAGPAYVLAIEGTTTARAQGATPVMTLLQESVLWGSPLFVLAILGTVAYARHSSTEPGEHIAVLGGRAWRVTLGLVLTGTTLLAPAVQIHLHTDVSFAKHIGFGLFFAAPMAGVGLARIIGEHCRRPQAGVALWGAALLLGMTQASQMFASWPNSGTFVHALSAYLKPGAHYLVEVPEVPIYYLMGRSGAQPRQFTSTYVITYRDKRGQTLSGGAGFAAAVHDAYFQVIVYNGTTTPALDGVLAHSLETTTSYRLARIIFSSDHYGRVLYYIWVKR